MISEPKKRVKRSLDRKTVSFFDHDHAIIAALAEERGKTMSEFVMELVYQARDEHLLSKITGVQRIFDTLSKILGHVADTREDQGRFLQSIGESVRAVPNRVEYLIAAMKGIELESVKRDAEASDRIDKILAMQLESILRQRIAAKYSGLQTQPGFHKDLQEAFARLGLEITDGE